jgi:hypothetical protein
MDTLEARFAKIRAQRELAGTNVHFLREDGTPDCYSFASMEKADKFRATLERLGRTILPNPPQEK